MLENERSARDLIERIKIATSDAQAKELANLAVSEIGDAIEVLVGGGLHRKAQKHFASAAVSAVNAASNTGARRIEHANKALGLLKEARNDIIAP